MFRPLRRIKQQLTNDECISILKNEVRGVLSVFGDNDYPYGIPICYLCNFLKSVNKRGTNNANNKKRNYNKRF